MVCSKMPITVFKEFRKGGKWPAHEKVTRVPYEIYTLAEAHDRGIEPVKNWREAVFKRKEDLTGQYVLTDDDPPLVTPIVGIRADKGVDSLGRNINKVHFPWTWTSSSTAKIQYGVKGHVRTSSVRKKFENTDSNAIKTFFLLFTLGGDPKKIVKCIWSVKNELEQEYLLRLIMTSEKTQQAVSELAKDVFSEIGASPAEIAQALWDLASNKSGDVPYNIQLSASQDIAERTMLTDKQEKPQTGMMAGFIGMGGGGDAPVAEHIQAGIGNALVKQAGGAAEARALLKNTQEEEASDK